LRLTFLRAWICPLWPTEICDLRHVKSVVPVLVPHPRPRPAKADAVAGMMKIAVFVDANRVTTGPPRCGQPDQTEFSFNRRNLSEGKRRRRRCTGRTFLAMSAPF